MSTYWPALAFALGGLCLVGHCVLLRRLPPKVRVPVHYQLVAWLGVLGIAAAMAAAMADYLTSR